MTDKVWYYGDVKGDTLYGDYITRDDAIAAGKAFFGDAPFAVCKGDADAEDVGPMEIIDDGQAD